MVPLPKRRLRFRMGPPKLVLSFCPKFIGLKLKRTPGVLLYYYEPIIVQITYVKPNRERLVASVTLQRAYEDVSILLDGPLQSVLCGRRSMQSLDRLDRLVPRPFVVSDDRL